jgi:ssDNA-binding Zn-finger/Zn-ribbon topoisomerase 1
MERSKMDEPTMVPCPECGGTGKVTVPLDNLPGATPPFQIDCPKCGGTGLIREQDE